VSSESLQSLRKNPSLLDILTLRALVASAQEDHNLCSAVRIINAVAWPVGDTHFHDSLADAPGVTRISVFQTTNAGNYARGRIGIPETVQPG
jgi:hypothetical protein